MEHSIEKFDKWNTYFDSISSNDAFADAEKFGYTVVFPNENTLQLDIDSSEAFELYKGRFEKLKQWYRVKKVKIITSKSGGNCKHVYIELAESLSDLERIFLQLLLGSDYMRELLSLQRIRMGDPHPTLFFEMDK